MPPISLFVCLFVWRGGLTFIWACLFVSFGFFAWLVCRQHRLKLAGSMPICALPPSEEDFAQAHEVVVSKSGLLESSEVRSRRRGRFIRRAAVPGAMWQG
jgi:hypothetical protein